MNLKLKPVLRLNLGKNNLAIFSKITFIFEDNNYFWDNDYFQTVSVLRLFSLTFASSKQGFFIKS